MTQEKILVLDFGGQYNQLIARRVRDNNVYAEILPYTVSLNKIKKGNYKGIIFTGGPNSVYDEESPHYTPEILKLGIPVLGICYGMQTMAQQLGGKVESGAKREFGYAEVRAHGHTKLLEGIEDFRTEEGHGMLKVWMSHGDKVTELPPGF